VNLLPMCVSTTTKYKNSI